MESNRSLHTVVNLLPFDPSVQNIGKDTQQVIETKDKQITELKRMLEESTEVRNNQFEKKVSLQRTR